MADDVRIQLGSMKIVSTRELISGGWRFGGYAIHYDLDGNEIGRTENEWNCTVTLKSVPPPPNFWQRLKIVAGVVLRWPS